MSELATLDAPRRMPGPAGHPLLGSMLDLRRGALEFFLDARRDHGDAVRITAGPPGLRKVLYAFFSPDAAQQILATEAANFRKDSKLYQEVRASAGNGLLTSQDADYVRQRRLLQPLFTRRRVDGYAHEVVGETAALHRRWRTVPGGVVDVVDEMSALTLRMTLRILFGTGFDAALDVVSSNFPYMSDYIQKRSYSFVSLPRSWPTPANKRAAAATNRVHTVCDRLIEQRRAAAAGSRAQDIITLLIQAENDEDGQLDADEIRDQVVVFLLASTETTATALAMALHLLARHPREQAVAREEARRVLRAREPVAADLDALPYITGVFREALRLYPSGSIITRNAVAATVIDGHRVPAGADVVLSPFVTHRHPGHWDDPERFDPRRFDPQREKTRHRYAWFPFGGGPRACIGRHFSMLESVLSLAMAIRDHELTAIDEQVPVKAGITLQTQGPVRVRVRALGRAGRLAGPLDPG
jgi:cytochrome P450